MVSNFNRWRLSPCALSLLKEVVSLGCLEDGILPRAQLSVPCR